MCIIVTITSTNTEQQHEASTEKLAARTREQRARQSQEFRSWSASNAVTAVHNRRTPEERSARAREVANARWGRVKKDNSESAPVAVSTGRVSIPASLWDCLLLPPAPGQKPLLDTYLKLKLVLQVARELWRDIGSKAPPAWTEPIKNEELAEVLGCTPQAVIDTVDYLVNHGILLDEEIGPQHRYALRVRNWKTLRTERKAG